MDDELKALFGLEDEDEAQAGVVDQQDEDVTDEGTGEDEEDEEELSPEDQPAGEVATHQQTRQENQVAAQARRAAEERTRAAEAERDKASAEVEILKKALQQYGYEGTAQEIADAIVASRTGQSPEEVERQRLAEEEAMNERIKNHPDVIRANQLAARIQQQSLQETFNRELREIQKINPTIRSLADLQNLGENQETFNALVKGGMHIDKAYRIAAGQSAAPAAKPDTKSHLKTTNGGSSQPAAGLSAEEIELCKLMNPGMTTKEINDWYAKHK